MFVDLSLLGDSTLDALLVDLCRLWGSTFEVGFINFERPCLTLHLFTFVNFESRLCMQRLSTLIVDFRCHVAQLGESTFPVGAPTLEHVGGGVHGTRCKCKSVLLKLLNKGAFVELQEVSRG